MQRRIAARRWRLCRPTGRSRDRWTLSDPDQDLTVLIPGHPSRFDEFLFEVCQRLVLQAELTLERAVGHPPFAAQQCTGLFDNFRELHTPSANLSSSALASCKSFVSKPSVNQW